MENKNVLFQLHVAQAILEPYREVRHTADEMLLIQYPITYGSGALCMALKNGSIIYQKNQSHRTYCLCKHETSYMVEWG